MTHDMNDALFPGIRFAHVLSLGGDCEASHGLRVADRHDVRGLFDWLVTPLGSIGEILADDGARLATRFIASHDGTSVRCDVYDVLYHHEFPRDAGNRVVFSPEILANCRAKLTHKMASFLRACDGADGPVLFLRVGLATNLAWDPLGNGTRRADATDLDGLAASLARRFPDLDFRVLGVVLPPERDNDLGRPRDPRVTLASLPRQVNGDWAIDDRSWHGLLARVAFADGRAVRNEALGETLYWFGHSDPQVERAQPPHEAATGPDPLAAASDERGTTTDGAEAARAPEDPNGLAALVERARRAVAEAPDDPDTRERLVDLAMTADGEAVTSTLTALAADGHAAPELAWRIGLAQWHGGRSAQAVHTLALAYRQGLRRLDFLRDYLGLLTGETHYGEVIAVAEQLRHDGAASIDLLAEGHFAMLIGHAKLALAHPRDAEIAAATARSASPAWFDTAALRRTIADAIGARRAFAFIRLGDGEARFLLADEAGGEAGLTAREADATGEVVWQNWFGEPLSGVDPVRRRALRAAYEQAVATADVVGACSPDRLRGDTGHYGYLVWQERWLRGLLAGRADARFADAYAHRQLNADMPFLADLLEGQEVLGVISPHPKLADALARRLRIGQVISHVVPAEGRLPTAAETRSLGRHFPAIYEELLGTLSVPRPGCVFLVAAGLLGKVYCGRIKALGGIALDIGALADAWMGYETRDGQNADVAALDAAPDATPRPSSPVPAPSAPTPAARSTTYGCVSFGKTGSMALADAMRGAGVTDAVHLHYLGPRTRAVKRANPEPMLDLADEVAGRIEDPSQAFRLVTSVRDPIARILSQAFYVAEQHRSVHDVDIVGSADALIAWWEARAMSRKDFWTEWFDDTFKTTFGFDFREHPFDQGRKSLRYESDRLRLLVLRQGDERSRREAELRWLLDRETVTLRSINDAANQNYESSYRPFLETFVAPASWLDTYYDAEVVRHFYTEEERDAFKRRWGHKKPGGGVGAGRAPSDAVVPSSPQASVAPMVTPWPAEAELATLRTRIRDGYVVDFNDFPYRPRERDWSSCRGAARLTAMFEAARPSWAGLLYRFREHGDRFRRISVEATPDEPYWENWWLPGFDAVTLYGLVANFAPRTFLEVGSGHSTRFVRRSIQDNGLATRIVSIDPNPTAQIDALCDEVVRTQCENAPAALFADLRAGDMLFFDGSHRSFQNSDATVFFTEILPLLPPGVIYGVHDVFLPFDYPESWTNRFYNEQYLLMTYLLGGAAGDEVIFPGHHVSRDAASADLRGGLFPGARHLDWLASSFWMRRGADG